MDESQAGNDQAWAPGPPTQPHIRSLHSPLGLGWPDLHRPEAVRAFLEARQLEGLRTVHAQLRARLLGGRPGPCHPGHGFRLLDSSPCVDSGDALYYRLVRVGDEAWHMLAAKVSPARAPAPRSRPWSPTLGVVWDRIISPSLCHHQHVEPLCAP